ncbi:hypothetical protein QY049_17525 [Bradyrhizobium sp. WYCCWR 13022]|uniref:hypothetical protein n=1 Tax=unclassified Bradyrhizobium TaxID=2631580 RepID=UPI00263AB145|nr:hypothetical protein [Bradyrhizobium sp. WYCCWR 13022]MDN4985009.1 hypothetical protein [Bradyrhizobium sp. WYCCWR 13022]
MPSRFGMEPPASDVPPECRRGAADKIKQLWLDADNDRLYKQELIGETAPPLPESGHLEIEPPRARRACE